MSTLGIAIIGPTASGKTRLAISLALQFGGEIVSCDALQVYRGMDIGTAKASAAEQELVTHHMLDIQDPDREFSAGDYQRMARAVLRQISVRGLIPFVTGGTGFYLRALIEGLFEGPERSEQLRERMRSIISRKGPAILHRALKRVDPDSAARIADADAERIIRAYEVYLATGKTMSWWQKQPRNALEDYRWLKIGIEVPREELYRRINTRVEEMFQRNFVEEVEGLLKRYPSAQAFKAIGYRQVAAYLQGKISLAQAIEETQLHSRRYAKRQLTWFRSDKTIIWLGIDNVEKEAQEVVGKFLQDHEKK
ncbi:MAG: tRNA (adenosine(37)-N6)-dimethylallyltransferase MiaA [Acidobacteria bacterium]|nr:tRNA (adenosine(37)-N6)-dimethylallyltransferase MiaA [Acidobacteriota bacterium]